MARRPAETIQKTLQEYADRGVIRELTEAASRGSRIDFRFLWLMDAPFTLRYDETRDALTCVDLLPDVPRGSRLYRELRQFLTERSDDKGGSLPKHRLVDAKRAHVSLKSRGGNLSVVLQCKNHQRTYGVRRLLNLVHEIFVFLRASHEDYLWRHFQLPQE